MTMKNKWTNWCEVDVPIGHNHECNTHKVEGKHHCQYGVWAPWYHDKVEQTAFNLYAMSVEEERDRATAIGNFILYLSNSDDPNDFWNQRNASLRADLDLQSLTPEEQKYIEQEVAERWQCAD